MAEHRGVTLPPISVVQVGDRYAIRDGHHRVSVAKARGPSRSAPSSPASRREPGSEAPLPAVRNARSAA